MNLLSLKSDFCWDNKNCRLFLDKNSGPCTNELPNETWILFLGSVWDDYIFWGGLGVVIGCDRYQLENNITLSKFCPPSRFFLHLPKNKKTPFPTIYMKWRCCGGKIHHGKKQNGFFRLLFPHQVETPVVAKEPVETSGLTVDANAGDLRSGFHVELLDPRDPITFWEW